MMLKRVFALLALFALASSSYGFTTESALGVTMVDKYKDVTDTGNPSTGSWTESTTTLPGNPISTGYVTYAWGSMPNLDSLGKICVGARYTHSTGADVRPAVTWDENSDRYETAYTGTVSGSVTYYDVGDHVVEMDHGDYIGFCLGIDTGGVFASIEGGASRFVTLYLVEPETADAGDVNMDGYVTFADWLIASGNYGTSNTRWQDGDVDMDGDVDDDDIDIIEDNM